VRVAIIPARGGSRRIPKKNIREFHGRPIIAYSIEAARESGLFDHIFVSSDDQEILKIARQCGAAAIERELRYAQDEVGTQEVVRDAIVELELMGVEPDYVCCIYATAPMLHSADLCHAMKTIVKERVPYAYADGWYYFGTASAFADGVPLSQGVRNLVPIDRWIDINTEDDWKRAEEMYAALHKEVA
jgi:pseudaminic acid cytidylyltransferase